MHQYLIQGLQPGTLYEVAVAAFNKVGKGPMSSPRVVDATTHDGRFILITNHILKRTYFNFFIQ